MLRKVFITVFVGLASFICCTAQDISSRLIPLSPVERIRYVNGYMEENNPDFDSFLQHLKLFAQQQKDDLLLSHIEYLIKRTPIFSEQDIHTKIEQIKKLQAECQKNNELLHVGDCLIALGHIQFIDEQYAQAFENLLAGENIFKQIGYENVPNMGKYLHDFALSYFFFQNYEKVITYMKESIKLPKYNDNLDIQRYNTLGVSYLKLNRLDSAYVYLNIAYEKAIEYENDIWIGLSAGNIGEVLFQKGDYQKALDYFSEDYRINNNCYSPDIQQNTAINMAKAHLKLGNMDKALHYLALTSNFFPKPKVKTFGTQQQIEQAKRNYYEVYHEYYLTLGNYKTALLYADSLHRSEKIRDRKYDALQIKMASGQLELLQSKLEFQKKELVYEKERRIRNIVIASLCIIFVLGILLAIFIFKNRQKHNRQKEILLNAQLEKAEHNLKIAELKLSDFTGKIQEKTRLVEDMRKQLALYPNTDTGLILQLQESTILTEEDWKRFRVLFEQVHSGFLQRIKEKYPEISPAEIRFLTLAKLNFSTKEMAAALGVSTQSIRTNWYRIRKKLNLPESMAVAELIETV